MTSAQDNTLRPLGTTGLKTHSLGFGCYRIHLGSEEHETALREYLDRGGNLIDTSANYTDGLSENLVGQVLQDYPRENVIVVSKGGYIQGQNMQLAQERHFPEVVHYGEGIWHCIHPEFLETQVERSLQRMRLEKVDVYLLHNPEYFLTEKEHHGGPSGADHEEFYRRVREAFRFLEDQVERGSISFYGISSNNYGLPERNHAATSVLRSLREAQALTKDHHFRVVQLPMNLYESGGALEGNNQGKSVLEFCRDEGLGVLVNRPLNAFSDNRLIRLADFVKPGAEPPGTEALDALLKPLHELEQRLARELQIPLAAGPQKGVAEILAEIVPLLQSPAHWEQVAGKQVISPIQSWFSTHKVQFTHDERAQMLHEKFIELVNPLFEDIARFLAVHEQEGSNDVRAKLHKAGYPETSESLSRIALNVLAGLPGMSCILNGMRRVDYVEDALGVVNMPPVDGLQILQRFSNGGQA